MGEKAIIEGLGLFLQADTAQEQLKAQTAMFEKQQKSQDNLFYETNKNQYLIANLDLKAKRATTQQQNSYNLLTQKSTASQANTKMILLTVVALGLIGSLAWIVPKIVTK